MTESITDLCNASKNGDIDLVKKLLDSNQKLCNQTNPQTKRKPIHYASREGYADPLGGVHAYGPDTRPLALAKDRNHQNVVQTIERWLEQKHGTTTIGETVTVVTRKGNIEDLKKIISESPETISGKDRNGNTPLHVAVRAGHRKILQWLLNQGADPNQRNKAGQKPIHIALHKDATTPPNNIMAGILLASGVEIDIWVAVAIQDHNTIKALLASDPQMANFNNGANLNPRGSAFPLTIAAKLNDIYVANLLLDSGADPNAALLSNDGQSEYPNGYPSSGAPLHCAIANGHFDMAHLLLNRGARADAPPEYAGNAPIDIAFKKENQTLINRMVSEGARPLLGTIISQKNYLALAEIIDRRDAPLSSAWIRKEGSENPLRRILLNAVRSGSIDVVNLCLNTGDSIDNLEDLLYQCMHHAKPTHPYLDVFKALLAYGADPNFKGPESTTPLHFVATIDRGIVAEERNAFAQCLLERGADINAIDDEIRSTPLGWASRFGRVSLVNFLLSQGAKPDLPADTDWATPLAWARKRNHTEIVNLLNNK